MLEKIDNIWLPFQKKHPVIATIIILIVIIAIIVLFIPLAILFIIGSVLHAMFFTGIVYKKDENNKPRRTWV